MSMLSTKYPLQKFTGDSMYCSWQTVKQTLSGGYVIQT